MQTTTLEFLEKLLDTLSKIFHSNTEAYLKSQTSFQFFRAVYSIPAIVYKTQRTKNNKNISHAENLNMALKANPEEFLKSLNQLLQSFPNFHSLAADSTEVQAIYETIANLQDFEKLNVIAV